MAATQMTKTQIDAWQSRMIEKFEIAANKGVQLSSAISGSRNEVKEYMDACEFAVRDIRNYLYTVANSPFANLRPIAANAERRLDIVINKKPGDLEEEPKPGEVVEKLDYGLMWALDEAIRTKNLSIFTAGAFQALRYMSRISLDVGNETANYRVGMKPTANDEVRESAVDTYAAGLLAKARMRHD